MRMPLRPARVAGGLRRRLATFFIASLSDGSGEGWRGLWLRLPPGRRPAAALISSVIDSGAPATSLSRLFFLAVARPEACVEGRDLLCRRAIPLGLRDAATTLEPLGECRQLAQPLCRHSPRGSRVVAASRR